MFLRVIEIGAAIKLIDIGRHHGNGQTREYESRSDRLGFEGVIDQVNCGDTEYIIEYPGESLDRSELHDGA